MGTRISQKKGSDLFIRKTMHGSFGDVLKKLNEELGKVGFGLITEIDMDKKFEEKLNVKIEPYKILGYCNPKFAYDALQINSDIGSFLPCTVVVKQINNSTIEVFSASPSLMMSVLENEKLTEMADEVTKILKKVIETELS